MARAKAKQHSLPKDLVRKYGFFPMIRRQWQLVLLSVPFLLFVLFNNYLPLWGWSYAFFEASQKTMLPNFDKFLGLSMFVRVFETDKFYLALRNTVAISALKLAFGYVGAITLALFINELRVRWFKRTVQTISYLPHFVSWVVGISLISTALSPDGGIVNVVLVKLHIIKEPVNWLMQNNPTFYFVAALSELWKEIGWSAIIYLAAMTGIDPHLYEAAQLDGAGRLKRILNITLPGISSTVKMLLILSLGNILSAGFEQMLLFQRPYTLDYSEVLDTYVYKVVWASKNPGRMYKDIPFATAIGMMNSAVSFLLILTANRIVRAVDGERLF